MLTRKSKHCSDSRLSSLAWIFLRSAAVRNELDSDPLLATGLGPGRTGVEMVFLEDAEGLALALAIFLGGEGDLEGENLLASKSSRAAATIISWSRIYVRIILTHSSIVRFIKHVLVLRILLQTFSWPSTITFFRVNLAFRVIVTVRINIDNLSLCPSALHLFISTSLLETRNARTVMIGDSSSSISSSSSCFLPLELSPTLVASDASLLGGGVSSSSSSSIAVISDDGSGCFSGLLLLILLLGAGLEDFAWTGELPATEVEGVRRVEAGDDLGWEDLGWDGLGPGLGAPKKAASVACLALGMGMSVMENMTRPPVDALLKLETYGLEGSLAMVAVRG